MAHGGRAGEGRETFGRARRGALPFGAAAVASLLFACSGGVQSTSGDGQPCKSVADCPLVPPDGCSARACKGRRCAVDFTAAGTDSATQTPSDCRRAVCDGAGGVKDIPDDLDLPMGGGECVIPSCNNGVPALTPAGVNAPCFGTCHCDGNGACAGPGCITDTICPQDPVGCWVGKCYGCEECSLVNVPAGTEVFSPFGDCKALLCDGNGGSMTVIDDKDVPDDSDPCTVDSCVNGVPTHAPLCPPPQTCNQGVCSP